MKEEKGEGEMPAWGKVSQESQPVLEEESVSPSQSCHPVLSSSCRLSCLT